VGRREPLQSDRRCGACSRPDATKIATGSGDKTACVWSLPTRQRLLDPFTHDNWVGAVKFSPRLIATATWIPSVRVCDSRNGRGSRAQGHQTSGDSVRVYDSQNSDFLFEFPVQVTDPALNQSLAWVSDRKQLFALPRDGRINCLDLSTETSLSEWSIHSDNNTRCIALASNGHVHCEMVSK
jgi:WD40 repeat protein